MCQSGKAYPGWRPPSLNSSSVRRCRSEKASSFRTRARWKSASPSSVPATCQSRIPKATPSAATPTGRRRGTDSRLRSTATSIAAPRAAYSPSARSSDPPTANMIAPAPEIPARLQAAVADTLGRLSARAISAPGSSTVSVAAASFR